MVCFISGCTFYHEKTDITPAIWTIVSVYQDNDGNQYLNLKSTTGFLFEKLSVPSKCEEVLPCF